MNTNQIKIQDNIKSKVIITIFTLIIVAIIFTTINNSTKNESYLYDKLDTYNYILADNSVNYKM